MTAHRAPRTVRAWLREVFWIGSRSYGLHRGEVAR